jgi:hypothetical protein
MKELHLTLVRRWWVMIRDGIKLEEYRELRPHWFSRLSKDKHFFEPREYDVIRFVNGYGKDKPTIIVEFLGVTIGKGNPKWGAHENSEYFVIKLGKILSTENV